MIFFIFNQIPNTQTLLIGKPTVSHKRQHIIFKKYELAEEVA